MADGVYPLMPPNWEQVCNSQECSTRYEMVGHVEALAAPEEEKRVRPLTSSTWLLVWQAKACAYCPPCNRQQPGDKAKTKRIYTAAGMMPLSPSLCLAHESTHSPQSQPNALTAFPST